MKHEKLGALRVALFGNVDDNFIYMIHVVVYLLFIIYVIRCSRYTKKE
jgi:hypothetical protein